MKRSNVWINLTDLMSGLMMVFLFIAVSFMLQAEKEKQALTEIALTYERSKHELHKTLAEEFGEDLPRWGAVLLEDNTIRFNEPDVLFAQNSSELNQDFKEILNDFFPRYLRILSSPRFRDEINELRIEGHTSSVWTEHASREEAYLNNARLSQDRSFNVLRYLYALRSVKEYQPWLTSVLRANGLAYAKRILRDDGSEDEARSRRVEIRVVTEAEEKIYTIIERSRERWS